MLFSSEPVQIRGKKDRQDEKEADKIITSQTMDEDMMELFMLELSRFSGRKIDMKGSAVLTSSLLERFHLCMLQAQEESNRRDAVPLLRLSLDDKDGSKNAGGSTVASATVLAAPNICFASDARCVLKTSSSTSTNSSGGRENWMDNICNGTAKMSTQSVTGSAVASSCNMHLLANKLKRSRDVGDGGVEPSSSHHSWKRSSNHGTAVTTAAGLGAGAGVETFSEAIVELETKSALDEQLSLALHTLLTFTTKLARSPRDHRSVTQESKRDKAEADLVENTNAALAFAGHLLETVAAQHPVLWLRQAPAALRSLTVALTLTEASPVLGVTGGPHVASSSQFFSSSYSSSKLNNAVATKFGRDSKASWAVAFHTKVSQARLDERLWVTVVRCIHSLPSSILVAALRATSVSGLQELVSLLQTVFAHRKVFQPPTSLPTVLALVLSHNYILLFTPMVKYPMILIVRALLDISLKLLSFVPPAMPYRPHESLKFHAF